MPKWRCVEKCWWENIFWSPQPDGRNVYDGDKTPPTRKNGRPLFVCIEPPQVKQDEVPQEQTVQQEPEKPQTEFLRDWMLKRMGKHELLTLLETNYDIKLNDEEVTKDHLVKLVLEKQDEAKSNQDIANTVKGY